LVIVSRSEFFAFLCRSQLRLPSGTPVIVIGTPGTRPRFRFRLDSRASTTREFSFVR